MTIGEIVNNRRLPIIVGISGATGSIYAVRLLERLKSLDVETHLVASKAAEITLRHEMGLTLKDLRQLAGTSYPIGDIGAAIASGSFETAGMIVAPCAIRTMAAVAHGLSDNLLTRAADVTLKERRRLILMLRETPLSLIHSNAMKAITEAGHKARAIVGFDLAHAAGNLELHLHDWNVDFAVWCSYKYLNAGPGAVAGAFVNERHAEAFDLPRFTGWWGHDKATRFLMGPEFHPMRGAEGWQISNPPILQMAALRASLEIFDEAGMSALREKSVKLTGYLEFLLNQIDDDRISIITPSDPGQRGCQLSIRVKDSDKNLFNELTSRGVFADWREPDVIRVAPAPMYNSFSDVYRFVEILRHCLE